MWQSGAVRIGKLYGVAIDVHLTFGLIVAWGAWQGWILMGGLTGAGYGVLSVLLLFACVLAHELGHAVQARALGLDVRQVMLLPLGGVAQLESTGADPWRELLFTLAGPLTNLGLALGTGIIAYSLEPFSLANWANQLVFGAPPGLAELMRYLFWVNVSLFLFNMLPAFPIDGGRIVRAAVAIYTDFERGTRVALVLGYVMATLLALVGGLGARWLGISPNPLLIVMAVIVALGARYEEIYNRRRWALASVTAGDVAHMPDRTLQPWDTVSQSVMAELLRNERTLPVLVDGRVVGLLAYHDVRRRVRTGAARATVAHYMRTDFPILESQDTLWSALYAMDNAQLDTVPVYAQGQFQGMIVLEDIQSAWRLRGKRRLMQAG